MLKRLFAALVLFAAPLAAHASPQLALEWGDKAAELHADTVDYIAAIDAGYEPVISAAYISELERFAVTAQRLSTWLAASENGIELACLMADIAEESANEIIVLLSTRDTRTQSDALHHLADILQQADYVARASVRRALSPAAVSLNPMDGCPKRTAPQRLALR